MKRSFIYLGVLTLFSLLILLVFAPDKESSDLAAVDTLLLPGISGQINEVSRVEIVTAGNNSIATLFKDESTWRLEQMASYRANWPQLRTLLAALAQARIIESKTDNPKYYDRLGVEDVNSAVAGGVLVKLSIGNQTTGIVIGRQAQGIKGRYVRLQNAAASALVDQDLEVPVMPLDWLDTTIVDVSASEVAEVELIHGSGERVLVTRISADQTDFDLVGLPSDREIRNSWTVNSLGSVFSMLELETVRQQEDLDWSNAVKMRMLLFSGVEIMAEMMETDGEYLVQLHASHPAADVVDHQPVESTVSVEQQEIDRQAQIDIEKAVDDINQNTTGWVYGISKQKFDVLVRRPEELLKPLESS
jgi:hypothetical protein